jgi:hypothetical protein
MNQKNKGRAAQKVRQPYVAVRAAAKTTIVACAEERVVQTEHKQPESEEPLGRTPDDPPDSSASDSSTSDSSPSDSSRADPNPSSIPTSAIPFEILWEHSKDALSTTYAAKNGAVDKILALRVFNARVCDSLQIKELQRAAEKASELTHLHIATVFESGTDDSGAPYVVSDLIEGNSLTDVLAVSKRLDIARFLNIFNQVGEALIEAHSHDLFHGNLSPEKIVLTPNEIDTDMVKVIDFGMPPDPVQNAFYLSPEQCLDKSKVNARSDIYSLGCVMYETLVGSPPFVGSKVSQSALNYLHELANQFPKNSPEHNALRLLDCIIIKCLQKEPAKRFRNVRELMNALQLVNDCICNGSTKKLPPKAEKLLIFRFLDLFGNKIAAGMTAYLILGFVCMRAMGELNLQKHIDQAAMMQNYNPQKSIDSWKSAIKQGEWLRKPPSTMAAMHRELGEAYAGLSVLSSGLGRPELGRKAIAEYEKALEYYGKGYYFRTETVNLLQGISSLWTSMETKDFHEKRTLETLKKVQKLWLEKKYSQCADTAAKFLTSHSDKTISYYAANANTEIAVTLPAAKALPYFERAAYYFSKSDHKLNFECDNLAICIARLNMVPDSAETRAALARAALERGDIEAAYYEFEHVHGYDASVMRNRLHAYLQWRASGSRDNVDPIRKETIAPLEKILAIEEQSFGKHSEALIPTLGSLANTYRLCGDNDKAIKMYQRYFKSGMESWPEQIEYIAALNDTGRQSEGRTYLENALGPKLEQVDQSNPLLILLYKSYVDAQKKQQAHDMLLRLVKFTQPERVITMDGYQYPRLELANKPYSRNGIIYRQ